MSPSDMLSISSRLYIFMFMPVSSFILAIISSVSTNLSSRGMNAESCHDFSFGNFFAQLVWQIFDFSTLSLTDSDNNVARSSSFPRRELEHALCTVVHSLRHSPAVGCLSMVRGSSTSSLTMSNFVSHLPRLSLTAHRASTRSANSSWCMMLFSSTCAFASVTAISQTWHCTCVTAALSMQQHGRVKLKATNKRTRRIIPKRWDRESEFAHK
mmetsp:Transcript_60161/g.160135  ORF Transcript_60161/g.160135 Transcript_60161/m.160135 type:complete len:212 (-) Transcript_60161:13-648(-)